MKPEIYISVDIEASGPIPGEYSMLSLGAAIVGNVSQNFYVEIIPLTDNYIPRALEVSGFSLDELKQTGEQPAKAMRMFADWLGKVCESKRPVFVGFNATFDWQFVNYYFHKFLKENPLGISGLDIKAYYMGMQNCSWSETAKRKMNKKFLSARKHTHNALDDAMEQAELMEKLLKGRKKQ